WWIVEGKDDRAFHGLGLLRPMPAGDEIEVGLRLCRGSWGLGIASEAASALIDYALRTIGLPHVVAVAYLDNRASRHVLEKLGFTSAGPCEYRGAHVERYVLGADAWRGSS